MAGTPERPRTSPLLAVVGGVLAALVVLWLVSIVVGTIVFLARVFVVVAVLLGGLWLWGKVSRS